MYPREIILIVEDDRDLAYSLQNIIADKGYSATVAENAAMAHPLLPSAALALIDLRLPDKPGIQVLKELKEVNPEAEGVIMTGYTDLRSALDSLNLGAYAYLEKPIDQEKLFFTIKRALEKRNLALQVRRREQEIKGVTGMTEALLNERLRLLEEARQRQEQIYRLYRHISMASLSKEPLQVGKEILPLLSDITQANYASLSFVGSDKKVTDRVEYFRSMEPIKLDIGKEPRSGGLRDDVLKTGKPLILDDIRKHPNPNPSLLAAGFKSAAGYPLKAGELTCAILFLHSLKEDAFSQYKDVISSFADLCAIPLRLALLYQEAERSRGEWETMVNEMRIGIVLMDKERNIIRANKFFSELVKRPLEELPGEKICELVHGHIEPIPECPMEKAYEKGEASEIIYREPFLGDKKLILRIVPIKAADGTISRFIHLFRDERTFYI